MSLRRLSSLRPLEGAYTSIGSMHEQVTILSVGAKNADGSDPAPGTFTTSWASVTALSGRELDRAQQIDQEVSHLVAIPYLPGIKPGMLVQLDTRIFPIQYVVDPDEHHVELRLYCVERGQNA